MTSTSRYSMASASMVVMLVLASCGAYAAGGRQLLAAAPAAMPSAPGTAPAGASAKPTADILFTVLAPSAQLSTDTLVLQNVAPLVPFYRTDGNTGLYTTGDFANSSAGGKFEEADGHWLHQPTAVLRAKDESGMVATSALLSLAQPRYDATRHTLTFQVKVLPAEGNELPLAGGAASRLHSDAQDGLTAGVLASAPAAGVKLANAALFVDQNSQQLGTVASVKWYGFGGPCPGFWGEHRPAFPAGHCTPTSVYAPPGMG